MKISQRIGMSAYSMPAGHRAKEIVRQVKQLFCGSAAQATADAAMLHLVAWEARERKGGATWRD
jgi:hypothetical protein